MEDALEAIIDYRGKTPKKAESGIPVLSAKSVKNNHIDYDACYYVSPEEYKRFMVRGMPQVGDVLLTTEAPMGIAARLDRDDVGIAQRLLTLRGKKEILDNEYLLYYLQSPIGQALLRARETGTTVTGIKQSEFRKIHINIPDIETQRKIGGILQALDKKCSINESINRNLSEQAMSIYKEMILDASDDCDEGILSDIADIVMGQSPKGDTYNEDGDGAVFYQGRAEFGDRFPTRRLFTTDPKRMAKENSVLMSVRAPVGDVNVAYEECCIGRGLCSVVSKDNHQSFVLYTMYSLKEQFGVYNGEGTVFGSINKDSMNGMAIRIPKKKVMDRFEEIVSPIDLMIKNNYDENCRLLAMRESLLPKLMSGELDVSDLDI